MHPKNRHYASVRGFTMLEVFIAIVFFSSAMVITLELFLAVVRRVTVHSRTQHDSRGPAHVLSTFSAAVNRGTRCAVYPDRDTFEKHPSLCGTAGNFAVIWIEDGSVMAFELNEGGLRIWENPNTTAFKERLFATGIEAPSGFCVLQNGALVLKFKAQIGLVQTIFRSSNRVASAR